jgi:hypothetical protein
VTVISNDSAGFAVALGDDAYFGIVPRRVEGHPDTDLEVLHPLAHARLLKVLQMDNDFLIELRELGLAEFGYVDGHSVKISNC